MSHRSGSGTIIMFVHCLLKPRAEVNSVRVGAGATRGLSSRTVLGALVLVLVSVFVLVLVLFFGSRGAF